MAVTAIRRFGQLYPGCRITMASYAKKESRRYGKHILESSSPGEEPIQFELIKNQKHVSHPVRIFLWRLLPFEKIRRFLTNGDPYLERFSQADLVVDLSGFAMSDDRSLVRRIVYCFEIFASRCFRKPFVVFTQALGPFKYISTRLGAKVFLRRVDLLIARGQMTYKFLEEIGIDRKTSIFVCSDMALLFESTPAEAAEGEKLLGDALTKGEALFGIVPNINIFHRTSPQDERNWYIQFLVRLCDYVKSMLGARVVFVCYERYEYRRDDEWLMKQVIHQAKNSDTIIAIDANHTAGELRTVIGKLDFVAASRFHSLVAAISTATPFFALGWAHKYDELIEDVGIDDSLLGFSGVSVERLLETIGKAWNRREETRKRLEEEHDRLCVSAEKGFWLVAEKWPKRQM